MPIILGPNGNLFRPAPYQREADFEADVIRLSDQIFGTNSLYVDVKKRIGNDIVTIPDGYLIDVTAADEPRLFVVENEIVSHDPFKHIGIQMLKFVTSFDDSKRAIRTFLMQGVQQDAKLLDRLQNASRMSSSPNVDHYLDRAVYADFRGLVIIDEARPELNRVIEKIRASIDVLELKAYAAENGERLFQFDTLYDDEDLDQAELVGETVSRTPEARLARHQRRVAADTIVVPAREEGFQRTFLGSDEWHAIRIGAAMKDRIKYIAAYRIAPIQAITHIAAVKEIRPYQDTGKYQVIFDGPAQEIRPVRLKEGMPGPQAPFYVQRDKLLAANTIDEVMS